MGTRYRYFTPDGGPPNGGAPPGAPKNPPGFGPFACPPSPSGPPSFCFGPGALPHYTYHPFGPQGQQPSMICHPISAPQSASVIYHPTSALPPQAVYIGSQPSSALASSVFIGSRPLPPPPPGPTWIDAAAPNPPPYNDAPPQGSRVKGLLPKFPDRNSGYIFPKNNCTFHIIKGDRKPWEWQGLTLDFNVMHAPTNMTLAEFIEQVGAIEKAPLSTPRDQIGVVEVFEGGNGTWHKGTAFMLGDGGNRMKQTLQEVGWDSDRGEAGRGKPVILVFLP
jgi:hypothetical protein